MWWSVICLVGAYGTKGIKLGKIKKEGWRFTICKRLCLNSSARSTAIIFTIRTKSHLPHLKRVQWHSRQSEARRAFGTAGCGRIWRNQRFMCVDCFRTIALKPLNIRIRRFCIRFWIGASRRSLCSWRRTAISVVPIATIHPTPGISGSMPIAKCRSIWQRMRSFSCASTRWIRRRFISAFTVANRCWSLIWSRNSFRLQRRN